ncbi:MAG: hypothetical protein LBU89_00170 [Fibromonadaceae bacterium]|jgi:hypothetical protein|nr:hypothetical protein [Fibromonadaceae bacterium]
MSIEIPAELLLPTVEELEERTARDLAAKWKPCKRLGKRERNAIKQERESAKLKAIAEEFDKTKQPVAGKLSSLFVQNKPSQFSLTDINTSNKAKVERPTLRVSLDGESTVARKRGRPPKIRSL